MRDQGHGSGHGAGLARTIRYARGLASGAVTLIATVAILDWTMPYSAKPSVMLGQFSGRHDEAELDTARRAQVQTAREVAIAQAAPPAAYQQETIILQHQQQAVLSALGTQAFGANLADATCMIGRLWADPSPENRATRDAMRDLGCGLGDDLRANMVGQLAQAGRTGSAIVPRTAAPDPTRMPPALPPSAPPPSPVARPPQVAAAGPTLTVAEIRRLSNEELRARHSQAYAPGRQLSPDQQRERAMMDAEVMRRR